MASSEELYQKAVHIATVAHEGQTRWDGSPYIDHPLAVASQFDNYLFKIVAVLHDVIEDTNVTADDLIDEDIPLPAVAAVKAMTHSNEMTYALYLQRLSKNVMARRVKTADLLHNLSDLDYKKNKQRFDKYLLALRFLNPRVLSSFSSESLMSRHKPIAVASLCTGRRGVITDILEGVDGWDNPEIDIEWSGSGERHSDVTLSDADSVILLEI